MLLQEYLWGVCDYFYYSRINVGVDFISVDEITDSPSLRTCTADILSCSALHFRNKSLIAPSS